MIDEGDGCRVLELKGLGKQKSLHLEFVNSGVSTSIFDKDCNIWIEGLSYLLSTQNAVISHA